MRTFNAYFKKEILESNRNFKYIIVGLGLIFFAILDPLMLKLLPTILKSQIPVDLQSLFKINRNYAINNYIKDIYQICTIIIIFTFSGTLNEEIWDHKLVFPFSRGASPISIVLSKFLHHNITILVSIFTGFLINYYYVISLFSEGDIDIKKILIAASLIGIYYIFSMSILFLFSSLFKKPVVSGVLTLLFIYAINALTFIKELKPFLPYKIIEGAYSFSFSGVYKSLILLIVVSIISLCITIYRLNTVEII